MHVHPCSSPLLHLNKQIEWGRTCINARQVCLRPSTSSNVVKPLANHQDRLTTCLDLTHQETNKSEHRSIPVTISRGIRRSGLLWVQPDKLTMVSILKAVTTGIRTGMGYPIHWWKEASTNRSTGPAAPTSSILQFDHRSLLNSRLIGKPHPYKQSQDLKQEVFDNRRTLELRS